MIQRKEVLSGQRIVVKVGIRIDIIERRSPLLPQHDYDIPKTGQAVNVDDNHEDQFEELQSVFHVLSHVHSFNYAPQA